MNNVTKNFSCKDEELLPIGKRTLFSLKRDLAEFTAYSPVMNEEYVSETEAKISTAEDLLAPQAETLAMGLINDRLNVSYSDLLNNLNKVEGYLKLTIKSLGITANGFGISSLRAAVNAKDAEAVVKRLSVVQLNINNYKAPLTAVGLTQDLIDSLETIRKSIDSDRLEQYEILTRRKSLVQNNRSVLNDLSTRISEIQAIGKVLYKGSDAVKLSEYTFTQLLTKVRQVSKAKPDTTNTEQKSAPTV
jgi:hypothetical protein